MTQTLTLDIEDIGPLIASGEATPAGEAVAFRYREVKDAITALETEQKALREAILAAAEAADPNAKSFPAGELTIRISETTRETVPVAQVRDKSPDLYDRLKEEGFVNQTVSKALSVR